jgi:nucleoside-diphosphate-sugar epimerase
MAATYLVTGAAGFIASKVCEFLLVDGNVVIGVDNLNNYYDVHLKQWRLNQLQDKRGFSFYPLDIEDKRSLDKLFKLHKFDAVFNLAARAGVRASLEHPELYQKTNVEGERNVLDCQVRHGVSKHVLASSSSLYAGCKMPFTEDLAVDHPQSPYAATKKAAELLAHAAHREHGLDVSVLRYFTVFGPAGRPDMAPFRFIKWIDEGRPITVFGDGHQSRDFTYVDDIAMGTVLAMMPVGYEVINLGGGRSPITLLQVIRIIEQALGKKARLSFHPASAADMKETHADVKKAKRLLGWSPAVSAEEGFKRTVAWHVEHRELVHGIKV